MTKFLSENETHLEILYENLKNSSTAPNIFPVYPNNLTEFTQRMEYTHEKVLPHILEICWFLQNPIFSNLHLQLYKNNSFWSGTTTSCWIPTTQQTIPALYTASIIKIGTAYLNYAIEKTTYKANCATAILLPICTEIDRSYKPTEEDFILVKTKSLYPRDFFEHSTHWKAFNAYSKQIQINRFLTG